MKNPTYVYVVKGASTGCTYGVFSSKKKAVNHLYAICSGEMCHWHNQEQTVKALAIDH